MPAAGCTAYAVYSGTASRLKPIIMTTLTTVLALLPMAINPSGTSSQASLSAAVNRRAYRFNPYFSFPGPEHSVSYLQKKEALDWQRPVIHATSLSWPEY